MELPRGSSASRVITATRKLSLTPAQQMTASCTGALMTSLLVTPLDVVKIRLQAQQKAFMGNKCFVYCNGLMDHLCPTCFSESAGGGSTNTWLNGRSTSRHFSGTVDAFVKISRSEGIRSLWSGLPPTLIMSVPSTVIYFTSYEQISHSLRKYFEMGQSYTLWVPLLSGSLARTGSTIVISPLELVRTKMQSKKLSYKEIGLAIRLLVQHHGYLSLWRGLSATLLRDVPFSAIYWSQYEFLRHQNHNREPGFAFNFLAGAIAGTVAAVLTLPFDVVKTHRQIELGEKEIFTVDHPQKSASTLNILKKLYRESGVKALFTGIVPRVVKVAPACAVMISTYEFGKAFFRRRNEKNLTLTASTNNNVEW